MDIKLIAIFFVTATLLVSSCTNGKKVVTHYKNGNKKAEYTIKNGHIDGWYYLYDSALAFLKKKVFFQMGRLKGQCEFYYPNGQIKYRCFFNNNQTDGIYRCYYPDGKDSVMGFYVNDTPAGNWVEYYHNGNYKETYHYKNGNLDSVYTLYYPTGINQIKFWCTNHKRAPIRVYDHKGKDSLIGFWDVYGHHEPGDEKFLVQF